MNIEIRSRIENLLSKEIKGKSLEEVFQEISSRIPQAIKFTGKQDWNEFELNEKVKFLMLLGLGRDRTIACISEHKVNRDNIKSAREAMNEDETNFRLESEKIITRKKIDSGNRIKRLQYFKEANLNWGELAQRYLSGESLNKLTKEYNVKVNYVTEQLKDDGIHDESRSTLLKNKKATELEDAIDNNFIIELVKNNPLDGKYALWEKAKKEYPWLLRKQMFDKLSELGLEKTEEEVNLLRGIQNKNKELESKNYLERKKKEREEKLLKLKKSSLKREKSNKIKMNLLLTLDFERPFTNKTVKYIAKNNPNAGKRALSKIVKKAFPNVRMKDIEEKIEELNLGNKDVISAQLIKANTLKKIDEVFGSLENLVHLYMENSLGSYSKIAKKINEQYKDDKDHIEVSTRQIEKAVTRHPAYVPRQSYPERQLLEFARKAFPECTVEREVLIPDTMKRMDVFLKELKVGIEFNGDYYHSDEVVLANYGRKAFDHHKERVEDAAKHGITLVYVWERDWNLNYDEVEKTILNKDWKNPILNKYSNSDYHRKVIAPGANKNKSE